MRVGEALPPAARPLLSDLGILDLVRGGGHLECLGNVSAWGSPTPRVHDFLLDPHGFGWHLDRHRFDESLRTAEAGAWVVGDARAVEVERAGAGWHVRFRSADGAETEARCGWLVDATGRGSVIARRLGAVRRREDRLVAFVARFWPAAGAAPDRDARTWIEAVPDGWWYTAPVPSGERVVAFHTDADIADRTTLRTPNGFAARLAQTPNLYTLLVAYGYAITGRPRGVDASSSCLDHVTGPGWLAVGDASVSFDPLSSQGLLNALYMGLKGGGAIHAALDGDRHALTTYDDRMQEIYRAYLDHRATFYASEDRWPTSPFWECRTTNRRTGASPFHRS